jgi:hypothetical protein
LEFVIESRDRASRLQLRCIDRHWWHAELRSDGLSATTRVSRWHAGSLADYFGDLAANWKGWDGVKRFQSYECSLAIDASRDRAGHVHLTVFFHRDEDRWKVQGPIVLDAGQLDAISEAARSFEAACRADE